MIEDFAERHRLKTQTDRDGAEIIPGKNGRSHIYEYADDALAFALMPDKKSAQWGHLSKRLRTRGPVRALRGKWGIEP